MSERTKIAAMQAKFVSSLASGETPKGFDERRFTETARVLGNKRRRMMEKSCPSLTTDLEGWHALFEQYAETNQAKEGTSARQDVAAFLAWIGQNRTLPDRFAKYLAAFELSRQTLIFRRFKGGGVWCGFRLFRKQWLCRISK